MLIMGLTWPPPTFNKLYSIPNLYCRNRGNITVCAEYSTHARRLTGEYLILLTSRPGFNPHLSLLLTQNNARVIFLS
uniref:Uncharacterized protein n=1 Tax=Anguilla anguilla TaxID=7936 RepID=A0A0E9WRM1_ANGAN